MTYSYTQISQYLRCPRSYRYRYLDGWKEKDTELPCSSAAASRKPWRPSSTVRTLGGAVQGVGSSTRKLRWSIRKGDNWERMLRQGVQLLERLAQDNRIRIRQPQHNCRSSSCGRFRQGTTSWPTSMPSGP